MDPDTALESLLDACRYWHATTDPHERLEARTQALDALENLTVWVGEGGFLPDADIFKG